MRPFERISDISKLYTAYERIIVLFTLSQNMCYGFNMDKKCVTFFMNFVSSFLTTQTQLAHQFITIPIVTLVLEVNPSGTIYKGYCKCSYVSKWLPFKLKGIQFPSCPVRFNSKALIDLSL